MYYYFEIYYTFKCSGEKFLLNFNDTFSLEFKGKGYDSNL